MDFAYLKDERLEDLVRDLTTINATIKVQKETYDKESPTYTKKTLEEKTTIFNTNKRLLLASQQAVTAEIARRGEIAKEEAREIAREIARKEEEARELASKEKEARELARKEEEARELASKEKEARELARKEEEAREIARKEEEAREIARKEKEAKKAVPATINNEEAELKVYLESLDEVALRGEFKEVNNAIEGIKKEPYLTKDNTRTLKSLEQSKKQLEEEGARRGIALAIKGGSRRSTRRSKRRSSKKSRSKKSRRSKVSRR